MEVVVVEPLDSEVVPLDLVKQHLDVEHGDHDDRIQAAIDAAVSWLDGPKGWIGLALGPQTLRLDRTGFGPAEGFELPCGPVTDVTEISWRDSDGTVTLFDAGLYELVEGTNRVRLTAGSSWPASGVAVSVTYDAGYATGADLPAPIRSAILLQAEILYDRPDEKRQAALEASRDNLLSPVRIRRV